MSGLTLVLLAFPGTALDALWRLNPEARAELAGMGRWALGLMLAVSVACALAARGLWRPTRLGYRVALAVLSLNLLGDTANAIFRHDWRTLIGLPIGGAMIAYLVFRRGLFLD